MEVKGHHWCCTFSDMEWITGADSNEVDIGELLCRSLCVAHVIDKFGSIT